MKTLQTFTRACILVFCFAAAAFGQPSIKLEHDSAWEIVRRQCTIRVFQIANLTGEDTGPLFVSIYARAGAGYDGENSPGILVARAAIGSLGPNEVTNNLVVTARARSIPPGEKYSALLVEKQNGRHFEVLDFVVFTSTYTFPRGQNGGVGSDDSAIGAGDVALRGTNALTGTRRRADFAIEEIQNEREGAPTGLLRLAIYATPSPYDGSANRVVIATRNLGRLAQGDFYNHLQGRLNLRRPGRGAFYLTLAIEEDAGSGFTTTTYVTYPEPRQF
jgi:hypothetical protein